jgi:hypothetical protein
LRAVIDNYIRDQAEKEAIDTYLTYVTKERKISELAQKCANPDTLGNNSTSNCATWFASELSTEPLADVQLVNVGNPRVFDPAWTNRALSLGVDRALSLGVDYDINGGRLPQFYFSLPAFFVKNPKLFVSMVARNEEAAAGASNSLLNTPHPQTLANPEILNSELRVLLAAASLRPDWSAMQYSDRLFSQAIQRVIDIDNFLHQTVGSRGYMQRVWSMLQRSLLDYDNGVQIVVNDALARPNDGAKKVFLTGKLGFCERTPPVVQGWHIHFPKDGPKGNIESLVPDIYWTAQDMGLGRVGNCFLWTTPLAR